MIAVDARSVANWFIETSESKGDRLSIMELLKLVYISHGWHLEIYDEPLFRNRIEAWKFGPVIPDVYNEFRGQGVTLQNPSPMFDSADLNEDQLSLLEEIYEIYGHMPAFKLSDITHESNGPWDVASREYGFFAPIGNDLIRSHYKQKRETAKKRK